MVERSVRWLILSFHVNKQFVRRLRLAVPASLWADDDIVQVGIDGFTGAEELPLDCTLTEASEDELRRENRRLRRQERP